MAKTGKIQITETILRDAHQSLIATRMSTEDMLPILSTLDEVGYFSLEVWGGATFDVSMRFLFENPWERLRKIRKEVKKTKLQMLLRGQNLVGYRHYADDTVERFIKLSRENGVDIFRIFDALNDIRNLEYSIKVAKDLGSIVEGTISYTVSPVHTIDAFVKFAKNLKDLGCDIICIKDMAGLISPDAAYNLVKKLKSEVKLPVHLHSHCTSGMAPVSYWTAAEAGVDIIDCAISPFSFGTSQPATETIVGMFQGTKFDTKLDLQKLIEIAEYFKKIREKYSSIIDPLSERVDPTLFLHQIPGGMTSNLISQLKEQNAIDKYPEVLREVARVRKELGYPPLVTPTSQIVGTQAVLNVLSGERYKIVPKEVKDYISGMYGRPPGKILPDVKRKILSGGEKEIKSRPADLIPPEYEKAKEELSKLIGDLNYSEEDIVSYILFPSVFKDFCKKKNQKKEKKEEKMTEELSTISENYNIELNGEKYDVQIKDLLQDRISLFINGKEYSVMAEEIGENKFEVNIDGEKEIVNIKNVEEDKITALLQNEEIVLRYKSNLIPSEKKTEIPSRKSELHEEENKVLAPMHGKITKIMVKKGDRVEKGKALLILEAMKMENEIISPKAGVVLEIFAKEGATVSMGDVLLVVG